MDIDDYTRLVQGSYMEMNNVSHLTLMVKSNAVCEMLTMICWAYNQHRHQCQPMTPSLNLYQKDPYSFSRGVSRESVSSISRRHSFKLERIISKAP